MKLNKKQEKYIRSVAQKIKAGAQIGKNEITESVITNLRQDLTAHELIKVRILPNALISKEEATESLQHALQPDYMYSIGHSFVLFKEAPQERKRKLSLEVERNK